MNKPKTLQISRREFARRAALASAAASLSPTKLLANPQAASSTPTAAQQTPAPAAPKLSAEGQIESDARVNAILAQYGSRFSDEQKTDLHRLSNVLQPSLDRLRKFSVQNGDGPALYLKPLLEREKKPSPFMPAPGAATSAPAAPPKKP
jgi:hypothetical protein